jgi:hypothetical protein
MFQSFGKERLTCHGIDSISYNIVAANPDGVPLFSVEDYTVDRHRIHPVIQSKQAFELAYKKVYPSTAHIVSPANGRLSCSCALHSSKVVTQLFDTLDELLSAIETRDSAKVFSLFLAGDGMCRDVVCGEIV